MPCSTPDFEVNFDLDWRAATPLDVFHKLLPTDFYEFIADETNKYRNFNVTKATEPLPPTGILALWKTVSPQEIERYFSIIIHMGLVHKATLKDYWSTNRTVATTFAPRLMSRDRFCAIHSLIHFSNSVSYIPKGQAGHDPLYKIRKIYDSMLLNISTLATVGKFISLDEAMCAFRGRFSHVVYNKSKPTRWGIKMYQVSDSTTGYTSKVEVFVGRSGEIADLVMRLLTGLTDTGRTVFMDRFFNSLPLTERLLARNTQVVGTVNTNRRGLPQPIKTQKLKRGEVISFRKGRIMCLKWKDKREVTMISTVHSNSSVSIQRYGDVQPVLKPVCIRDYNEYMGGVDKSDQLMSYYPFLRKSLKWYKKLFFRLFYLLLTNAHIIYNYKRQTVSLPTMTLYQFYQAVCSSLAEGIDFPIPNVTVAEGRFPLRITERHFPGLIPPTSVNNFPTRRCVLCTKRGTRKQTRFYCFPCSVALCVSGCFEQYHTIEDL